MLAKEGGFQIATEASTSGSSSRQAFMALTALEVMIANDNTRVIRLECINDRVFFRALHNMYKYKESMASQILYGIRILARMAEECPVFLPCQQEDKELLEVLLFPEQNAQYIFQLTLIIKRCIVGEGKVNLRAIQ